MIFILFEIATEYKTYNTYLLILFIIKFTHNKSFKLNQSFSQSQTKNNDNNSNNNNNTSQDNSATQSTIKNNNDQLKSWSSNLTFEDSGKKII